MEKKKKDLIVASVLVLALFFLLAKNSPLFSKKHETRSRIADSVAGAGDITAFMSMISQNERALDSQEVLWEKDWGRDPFSRGMTGGGGPVNIELSGIVWDSKMPVAIVNGNVMKAGELIESYQIVEIKPNSIVLVSGEDRVELELYQTYRLNGGKTQGRS